MFHREFPHPIRPARLAIQFFHDTWYHRCDCQEVERAGNQPGKDNQSLNNLQRGDTHLSGGEKLRVSPPSTQHAKSIVITVNGLYHFRFCPGDHSIPARIRSTLLSRVLPPPLCLTPLCSTHYCFVFLSSSSPGSGGNTACHTHQAQRVIHFSGMCWTSLRVSLYGRISHHWPVIDVCPEVVLFCGSHWLTHKKARTSSTYE